MAVKEKWAKHTEDLLREIGIAEGHAVLDCCCGSGVYTIAAATVVGRSGLVYAIDSNSRRLGELNQKAELSGLGNIKIIEGDVESAIPLTDSAVDFVLLYDIFWYFRPTENKMEGLLEEVGRVAKPSAVISVYPTHVDPRNVDLFKDEMKDHGFILVSELSEKLVHEKSLERGRLLNFRNVGKDRVKLIEEKIEDLKKRLPIHSVPPSMLQELEDLEEELERIRRDGG